MGMQLRTQLATPSSSIAEQTGLLQRKCACGQHTIVGDVCAECRQKHEGTMQRTAVNAAPVNSVPPIVHDVLSSSGKPLDAGTRAFMEPRFGHDFSQVRVHTGERAAESAQAVNALAYTVGRDVVFGTGQFTSATTEGQRLLAHELTHVVQQANRLQQTVKINQPGDQYEKEADHAALAINQRMPFSVSRQGNMGLMRQPSAGGAKVDPDVAELKMKVGVLVKTNFDGDYQKAFDHYDADHNGGVDSNEIKNLLKDADVGNRVTRGTWASRILERLDTNKDGKIDWQEFKNGIK